MILESEKVLQVIAQEVKTSVSGMMTRISDDREITKTPIIFALENNLNENFVKVLVGGAKTEDIVDLVLYSRSNSSADTFVDIDDNPRKKIRLDH